MFPPRPRFLIFAFFGAAMLLTSCGGGGGSSSYNNGGGCGGGTNPPQNHVWVGKDGAMAFKPVLIHVAPGATVTWDFYGTHTVTSTTSGTPFDSGTLSTGTFTHEFPTEGTYTYYCTIHGAMMSGTVIVQTGGTGY